MIEAPARISRRLEDRVAVVTGGNKGMGRVICLELAREGADVAVLAGRDLDGATAVAAEISAFGRRGLPGIVDITSPASVDEMIVTAVRHFGKVDILVNCAGSSSVRKPLEQISEREWDRVFDITTKGTFLCSAAAARQMMRQKSGVIVNIAGASAHRSYPRFGAFGPAKAAVVSLTRQASIEWAPYGIRVNGVSPGPIRDPGTAWQEQEPELAKEVQLLPMRRAGTPFEVARTVVYLASDDGGYVTGQMIIVDGGGVNTWYLSASTSRRNEEPRS
jgi:NAD(P)-dependent dehydrogenase (short-subunit alcohol dehydrogenase family)